MGNRPAVVFACLVWTSVAHAQSVANTNDSGTGSLRNAILNAASGTSTITISAQGTIALLTPLPTVVSTVTIIGPGADKLTIQGSATPSPVLATNGTVQVSGVTLTGGANTSGNGGGIAVLGGSLVLDRTVISANAAQRGSAIDALGKLTIRRSTISANTMGTSAVYAADDTTVIDSTIDNNEGTAIMFPTADKTLSINRSTISGATGGSGAGGLEVQGGTATIVNTTFSGNAGVLGSDVWASGGGVAVSLLNVTAAGGNSPSLRAEATAAIMLRNTLLAGTGARCVGSPTSQGHNLSSDATCNLTSASDKAGVDAKLGALAANGGLTRTYLPLAGSPALNAGDGAQQEEFDQRGKARVQFGVADIGAVEAVEPIISTQPVAPQALVEGDSFTITVAATNQDSATALKFQWRKDGAPIAGATSATYTKTDTTPADSGTYDVLVINDGGELPSQRVAVTVTAAIRPDGPTEDDGGGGCCSSSHGAAGSSAVLVLLVLGALAPRRARRS